MHAALDAIADMIDRFAATTRTLEQAVDTAVNAGTETDAYRHAAAQAHAAWKDADDAILDFHAHSVHDQYDDRDAYDGRPHDPADLSTYINDTYLAAVDRYYDQIERAEEDGLDIAPLLGHDGEA